MKKPIDVEKGSGNVFKDLGLPDADELLLRSRLIMKINDIVSERGLKQTEVAKLVGMTQGDVSMLLRGTVGRFSTDRVMQVLNRLGTDIEIVMKPAPKRRTGRIIVKAA